MSFDTMINAQASRSHFKFGFYFAPVRQSTSLSSWAAFGCSATCSRSRILDLRGLSMNKTCGGFNSSCLSYNLSHPPTALEYLTCADCERGVLGLQYLDNATNMYLTTHRIKYLSGAGGEEETTTTTNSITFLFYVHIQQIKQPLIMKYTYLLCFLFQNTQSHPCEVGKEFTEDRSRCRLGEGCA